MAGAESTCGKNETSRQDGSHSAGFILHAVSAIDVSEQDCMWMHQVQERAEGSSQSMGGRLRATSWFPPFPPPAFDPLHACDGHALATGVRTVGENGMNARYRILYMTFS